MRKTALILPLLLSLACAAVSAQSAVPSIDGRLSGRRDLLWDLKALSRVPQVQWLDTLSPVRSLLFESVPYRGKPTRAFAYYSNPDLLMGRKPDGKKYPGVVLLHGGAGRAFREWVELWASQGYAAIAMDLSGNGRDGARLPDGGPDLSDTEAVFMAVGSGDLRSVWTYQAVSTAILSHSLLLSFPEVDAGKTCLTGISWGGYLTCIVASLDNRFRAAAPVYGCGYYDRLAFFAYGMDRLDAAGRKKWMEVFDPSAYLRDVRIPMLFVNGNSDTAYDVFAWRKSYNLVPDSLRSLCIRPGMLHGYYEGWEPREMRCFFDGIVGGGCPLPAVTQARVGDSVRVDFRSAVTPCQAVFYYTSDTLSANKDREWKVQQGALDPGKGTFACPLPDGGFRIGFVTIRDMRQLSASTGFIFADDPCDSLLKQTLNLNKP